MHRPVSTFPILAALLAVACPAAVRIPHGQIAWIVAGRSTALDRRTLSQFTEYIGAVAGVAPTIVARLSDVPKGHSALILLHGNQGASLTCQPPAGSEEAFCIAAGSDSGRSVIVLRGASDKGLKRAMQRLVIESRQADGDLQFPDINVAEKPWIPEREWAICPWVPQQVRGVFVNPFADNRLNIWLFGDRQLERYVDMFDWFGFSGVQLIETGYSYGVMGSPEAFHAPVIRIAQDARVNGQKVSLWVWAAKFNSYGWRDPSVVYRPRRGLSAFDDPAVRRSFEKYYDIYAALAPYVDRVIGHFYDPGELEDRRDVFRYMRLLESKFHAANPAIKMSIDTWAAGDDYPQALIDNGFTDYLMLEMSMPNLYKPGQRERLHREAKRLGLKLGVWGWYTTEYETDQLPAMFVNAKVLAHFYRHIRDGAAKILPLTYWSEMEANHINNLYSMYAAGQLLWNPLRDPDEVLAEISSGIWGPVNGPKVLAALKLIQDARSGPTWDTYWWAMPDYRLGKTDAAEDLRRAEESIRELAGMRIDGRFVPKFPLPYPPAVLRELILKQLEQVRAFVAFRVKLNQLREEVSQGLAGADLSQKLSAIWQPVPELDTWIGTFGQPEARMQEIMLRKAASDWHVPLREPSWLRARDAERLLEKIEHVQLERTTELRFKPADMNEFYWTPEKLKDRFDKLVADGSVEGTVDGRYRLADWRNFTSK
jgi:hypothetical protein